MPISHVKNGKERKTLKFSLISQSSVYSPHDIFIDFHREFFNRKLICDFDTNALNLYCQLIFFSEGIFEISIYIFIFFVKLETKLAPPCFFFFRFVQNF